MRAYPSLYLGAAHDAPGLVQSGRFYPSTATTDEERLHHYATRFRLTETVATFETPPTSRTVAAWAERTPDTFRLDVRAYRLLSHYPTTVESMPAELRDALPPSQRGLRTTYVADLPPRVLDIALDQFLGVLEPLHRFGKLGVVLFQFPPYFAPSPQSLDYLAWLQDRGRGMRLAVELRNAKWLDTTNRKSTLAFLEERGLAYVCVDGPQGLPSSVPPVAVATSEVAVVRFYGRNIDTWEQEDADPSQRYAHDYRRTELEPWKARLERLASGGHVVHAVMSNAGRDLALRGVRLIQRLLTEPPDERPPPEPAPRRRPPSKAARRRR